METILKVENLFFGYKKEPFLKNICFEATRGEMISVIGENGSGKSTLIKVINGNLKSYDGKVIYNGENLKKVSYLRRAREISVLYQNCECDFPFSCFEIVSMGLYPHKGNLNGLNKDDIDFIKSIMTMTETIEYAHKSINSISGGQKQKVFIARALSQKPKLLFLDEAASGLDISSRIKMTEIILRECKNNGVTVINISHDINLAFEKSDKILALKNGEVYSFGKPKDLLNKDFFREVFNVEVKIDFNKKYFRIIT